MDYLIWSNKHHAWWGPARHGYGPLAEAGVYTEVEAVAIVRRCDRLDDGNPGAVMIPAPDMDLVRRARAIEEILELAILGKNAIERKTP